MKKNIVLLSLLTLSNYINAQQNSYVPSTEVTPPSLENYFFTKNGNLDISGNKGGFSHQLPIYSLKNGDINLNLNLTYYTDGVKVNDIAGLVGMGWNLNAGGMITRVVKGLPDEHSQTENFRPPVDDLEVSLRGDYTNAEYIAKHVENFEKVYKTPGIGNAPSNVDTQQDVFSFNFNGYNGTFYLDNNVVYIDGDSDIKISYSKINKNLVNYLEFTLITPDGISYIFGGDEPYVETTTISTNCSRNLNRKPNTTWYLKQIRDQKSNYIDFVYQQNGKNYPLSYSEYYQITYGDQGFTDITKSQQKCTTYFDSYNAKYLKNISASNGNSILFENESRSDYSIGYRLKSFEIKNNFNQLIKSVNFNYVYSQAGTSGATNTSESFLKRLFLNSLVVDNDIYKFEYDNINSLPARLSTKMDYYGYPNNNSTGYLTNFSGYGRASEFTREFGKKIADRSSIEKSYGSLTKIIYPTKGFTSIEYESNKSLVIDSYTKEVYDGEILHADKFKCAPFESRPSTDSFQFTSKKNQFLYIPYSNLSSEQCPGVYLEGGEYHDVYEISVIDISTGQNIMNPYHGRFDKPIRTINPEDETSRPTAYDPIPIKAGKTYKVTMDVSTKFNRVQGTAKFIYNPVIETFTSSSIKNIGGVRVKKITDNNGIGEENIKEYKYNSINNLNSDDSSISLYNNSSFWKCGPKSGIGNVPNIATWYDCPSTIYNTDDLNETFNSTEERVKYKYITKLTKNGYEENEYNISQIRNDGHILTSNPIYNINSSNNKWDANQLLKTRIFSSVNGSPKANPDKEIINEYKLIKSKRFDNYNIEPGISPLPTSPLSSTNSMYPPSGVCYTLYCAVQGSIAVSHYYNYTFSSKLKKQTIKEHFPNGTLTTETNYNYDSANHLQLTSQTTKNSKGETITTEYQYPPDLTGNYIQNAEMIKLVNTNRISEPVIINQKVGDVYTSEVRNQYNEFNGIIQKSAVYQKKGKDIGLGGTYDRVIKYESYDTKGNLTQYTLENGIPVSIIWGYNGQYPILKVEGVALQDIPQWLIDYIKYPSDVGDNQSLFVRLNYQRNEPYFKDALVTGYIYKPLVGVTQIIQPNGMTEKYNYDTANRLKSIVNDQNEVIKTFEYN
ncbi:hypothetical protein, partial [Empedobacter brevis]|uniref:hypothetical protein n=1 Tax=Empedobacter brevis TaxID=247 RepID=UPI0028D18A17